MTPYLIAATIAVSAVGSAIFSTLNYSLRELSRVRLTDYLQRRNKLQWLEQTMNHVVDLVFVTAVSRMLCNIAMMLACLWLGERLFVYPAVQYLLAGLLSVGLTLIFSILLPDALTRYAGNEIVGAFVAPLCGLRVIFKPVIGLLHSVDGMVRRAVGLHSEAESQQTGEEIQQEILSAVEEGEKEGVVDEQEREMIESVIHLRETTAGQIMTPRTEVVAIEIDASLDEIKQTLEESGNSRVPVYHETLDHISGILYARDLLKFVGQSPSNLDLRSLIRPAFFVPESMPLRDLLRDFRLQKVHIAIVLDEYSGAVGLVTIEDILEEVVGDISDEHEPKEPAMFKRIDDHTAEADARIYVDELNRLFGLNLPEDAGYDTLAGFVTTTLGKIPPKDTTFDYTGAKFTILDAEPQRVNRVKIAMIPEPVEAATAATQAAD